MIEWRGDPQVWRRPCDAGGGRRAARAGDLEFLTGEALYAQCSAKPAAADYLPRQARCAGYVLGVSDALQAARRAQGAAQRVAACPRRPCSSTQLVVRSCTGTLTPTPRSGAWPRRIW